MAREIVNQRKVNTADIFQRLLFCAGLFLLTLLSFHRVSAAEISVGADRNPVSLDESFHLVFSARGEIDDDPDFSPLEKDFDVLGTQQSSQISIINGKRSSEKKWIVSLLAKRSGEIAIPAISFGKDVTQAGVISVKESGDDREKGREIFVQVEAATDSIYVQQQLNVTVRVYRSIAVANATLSPLTVSGVDTFVENVTADNRYRSTIDGKLYDVFERYYALYPQVEGELTLNQVIFKATKGMNRFFADPFGEQPKSIIRRSEEKTIQVKPIPAAFSGTDWLPLHSLKLEANWSRQPPEFRVGEPMTLTLSQVARGLPASQLPELRLSLPAELKTYPDQPVLKNESSDKDLVGIREDKIAIIPSSPGRYTLPEINIPYWSIADEKTMLASIPAMEIEVLPALLENTRQATANVETLPPSTIENNVNAMTSNGDSSTNEHMNQQLLLWQSLAIILLLVWLLTLYLWRKSQQEVKVLQSKMKKPSLQKSQKSIQTACKKNDAKACQQSLLNWGSAFWPDNSPQNLEQISQRLQGKLQDEINDLNLSLYGQDAGSWDGEKFWQSFQIIIQQQASEKVQHQNELEPIFKLN